MRENANAMIFRDHTFWRKPMPDNPVIDFLTTVINEGCDIVRVKFGPLPIERGKQDDENATWPVTAELLNGDPKTQEFTAQKDKISTTCRAGGMRKAPKGAAKR